MTEKEAIKMLKDFKYLEYSNGISISKKAILKLDEAFEKAIEALENYTENKWISCSERLPDEGQTILAQYNDNLIWMVNFRKFLYENPQSSKGHKIVMWMPLPEPYEGN